MVNSFRIVLFKIILKNLFVYRLWWGKKSRYIGFFGQQRPFTYPTAEDSLGHLVLPYDITEVSRSDTKWMKRVREK